MVVFARLHDKTLLRALAYRDEGLSYKEIARKLKSTEKTIERVLRRIDVELAISEMPDEEIGGQRKCR